MADLRKRAVAFVAGESIPMMRGGTPVASYECENFRAILAREPQSMNANVRYLHALLVYPGEYNKPPLMYVVAEQARVTPLEMAALPPEVRKILDQSGGPGIFLCAFTDQGKINLGASDDLVLLERFESRALATMREALNLLGEVRVLNDTRRGGAFPATRSGIGCLVLLCAAPFVGYGIVVAIRALLA
jgi:hypothetical protein